jgi:Animal haem peroxidase
MPSTHHVRDHCLAPTRAVDAPVFGGRYGRLFPGLGPLVTDEPLLHALGRSDGPCDATPFAESGGDDAREAAGWPLFGQFIAHDITADRSPVTHHADPDAIRNFRTPRVNLECVYGGGPMGSPYLFERTDTAKLLLGFNDAGRPDDVPRNSEGIALIGDPRNDVHLFVAQLHVVMIKLHNGLVDRLREDGVADADLFDEARRAATWHYQWVVLRDFLPRLIGEDLTDHLLRDGPQRFLAVERDAEPFIPFEFADAAYRYGHSQIRHSYRLARDGEPLPVFPDLVGFRPLPAERALDWTLLFDFPGEEPAQRAKKIDGRLPRSLIQLPVAITGDVDDSDLRSLAVRDLERGSGVGLPSGEAVASELGVAPVTSDELGLPDDWHGETPLWFYILKEAEARGDGDELGPVGARIVGEVLVGLIDRDPESFRSNDSDWRPTLGGDHPEGFGMADLVGRAATSS